MQGKNYIVRYNYETPDNRVDPTMANQDKEWPAFNKLKYIFSRKIRIDIFVTS